MRTNFGCHWLRKSKNPKEALILSKTRERRQTSCFDIRMKRTNRLIVVAVWEIVQNENKNTSEDILRFEITLLVSINHLSEDLIVEYRQEDNYD